MGGEFPGTGGKEGGSFGKTECEDGGDSGIPVGAGTLGTGAISDGGPLLIGATDL